MARGDATARQRRAPHAVERIVGVARRRPGAPKAGWVLATTRPIGSYVIVVSKTVCPPARVLGRDRAAEPVVARRRRTRAGVGRRARSVTATASGVST
jgi:hypothetical protein